MSENICIITPFEGCGATSAAVNLAAGIAVLEHRCLLLDLDPACTAICALRSEPFPSSYLPGLTIAAPSRLREAILPTALKFLHCIPASIVGIDFSKTPPGSGVENKTIGEEISGRLKLLFTDFEFIVLHIPSSLGVIDFTNMPLPDRVWVPVAYNRLKPEKADATSNQLDLFFETLNDKNNDKNKKQGGQFQPEVLVTMTPYGLSEIEITRRAETIAHGHPVLFPSIPQDEAMRKAALFGESVFVFDITSPAAEACLELSAGLVETAAISIEEKMKKLEFSRDGGVVYRKTMVDARREMIRRLSAGIDIEALKAELLKTAGTTCNDRLKFLDGDFVSHDGVPAFRLDFQYNGLWSVIIGIDGEILSIIEKFSSREDAQLSPSEDAVKEKSMAEKLAEIMSEINK